MTGEDYRTRPHRRYNPLLREWVLVSPQRTQRPWQGKVEKGAEPPKVTYDPECYLCPGNGRAGGGINPKYETTFVFDNDYPALLPAAAEVPAGGDPLLMAAAEAGRCRVVCFSPRHDLTMARMTQEERRRVVDVWREEMEMLEGLPWVRNVQIFENRGALMGASNPHPHCQIWANGSVPNVPARELEAFRAYEEKNGRCLLCDYVATELREKERIVCANEEFVAVVPFWAVWPFETMILSKRHRSALIEFTAAEKEAFADILGQMTVRYDNLFETAFPYSMGLHQRPVKAKGGASWHFHAHFLPPLLRSATVQKFMVGYELLATPQRDITAEDAAKRLAELPAQHYLDQA